MWRDDATLLDIAQAARRIATFSRVWMKPHLWPTLRSAGLWWRNCWSSAKP